ncbi:MAG: hypothetical protein ABSA39_03040 [Edaphobacter sp.]
MLISTKQAASKHIYEFQNSLEAFHVRLTNTLSEDVDSEDQAKLHSIVGALDTMRISLSNILNKLVGRIEQFPIKDEYFSDTEEDLKNMSDALDSLSKR